MNDAELDAARALAEAERSGDYLDRAQAAETWSRTWANGLERRTDRLVQMREHRQERKAKAERERAEAVEFGQAPADRRDRADRCDPRSAERRHALPAAAATPTSSGRPKLICARTAGARASWRWCATSKRG